MGEGGVSLWRQISQTIGEEIDDGILAPGDRLPASNSLAARFGVNRHTVLKAISHLQDEGLIRTERGGGIYVEKVIPYRMGARTRLEENLLELNRVPSRTIVSVLELRAPRPIADALDIDPGAPALLVTLIGAADEVPVSFNQNYFPIERLPDIAASFDDHAEGTSASLSTAEVLARHGVQDFRRRSVRLKGRGATQAETRHLQLAPTEMVFEVDVVNVDQNGVPIVFGRTSFCMSRVEFILEMDATEADG